MAWHVICNDILLIARVFPRPFGAQKKINTTQLAKYLRVLYVKPSNKMYLLGNSVDNTSSGTLIIINPLY